jgi:hypothetical protein
MIGGGNGNITVPVTCPPGYEEQGGQCVPIGGTQTSTMPTIGSEIINVHACPPGYEDQGGQCVPIGGPTLTFTDVGNNQGGGAGSGGQQQPPPGWKLCPGEATKTEQDACSEWVVDKPGGGKIGGGQIMCDEKGKVFCCIQDGEGSWRCLPPSSLPGQRRLPPVLAGGAVT